MDAALERLVWRRAKGRCEYCHLPQDFAPLPHEIDHIIARKHHGPTVAGNLALSCYFCNSYKGPNLSGVDPETGRVVRLFHPRKDSWKKHFRWDGPRLVGLSRSGRATVDVLEINRAEFVALREMLMRIGVYPL